MQQLAQDYNNHPSTCAHVDPSVAFPFQDDFSVGTIHGANTKNPSADRDATVKEAEVVEVQDDEDNVSVLTTKTQGKDQPEVSVGSRIDTGPNPVSRPTAASAQAVPELGGLEDLASAGEAGGATGGRTGKYLPQFLFLHPREGGQVRRKADCSVGRHLHGAEEVSNVHQVTDSGRQPVGSNSCDLHVLN